MSAEQREKLKPCPFCGKQPQHWPFMFGVGSYYGFRCCVVDSARRYKTQEEAFNGWNTRAAIDAHTEEPPINAALPLDLNHEPADFEEAKEMLRRVRAERASPQAVPAEPKGRPASPTDEDRAEFARFWSSRMDLCYGSATEDRQRNVAWICWFQGAVSDAALARAAPQAVDAPVAWYVERHAPGKRDHGMKLGPFWKKEAAEEWVDDRHHLKPLYALKAPAKEPEGNADV